MIAKRKVIAVVALFQPFGLQLGQALLLESRQRRSLILRRDFSDLLNRWSASESRLLFLHH